MILSHWSHLYINRTCLGSSNYGCDRYLQYQMSHYEIISYWPKFEVLHLGTKRLDCWFICLSYSNSWWLGVWGKNMDELTFILHLFYHKRGNLCPCAKLTTFVLFFVDILLSVHVCFIMESGLTTDNTYHLWKNSLISDIVGGDRVVLC